MANWEQQKAEAYSLLVRSGVPADWAAQYASAAADMIYNRGFTPADTATKVKITIDARVKTGATPGASIPTPVSAPIKIAVPEQPATTESSMLPTVLWVVSGLAAAGGLTWLVMRQSA